jgi:G:T-mismatch repair DNA endonuclease (very short patch repair protein)
MGMRAPKRKPSKLEIKVGKMLGDEWEFVGDGKVEIGGLVPDFVHKTKREVLEVLGCYYHSCPVHFPNIPLRYKGSPAFREAVFKASGYQVRFIWEHDVKKVRGMARPGSQSETPK